MRRNKYGAIKTTVDGYRFDSKKEANHYGDLKLLERAGEIKDLATHPQYRIEVNGAPICIYEADFSFVDSRGTVHVQDVKGCMTALSRLKIKLVEALYGIKIEIIR